MTGHVVGDARKRNQDEIETIAVPRAEYDDLVNGVEAMGDRAPTSRAEWMARDLVAAVQRMHEPTPKPDPYCCDLCRRNERE